MEKTYLRIAPFLFLALFSFKAGFASAATFKFEPAAGTFKAGETFKLNVYLDPQKDTIDMIRLKLNFPPTLLEITDVYKNSQFKFSAGGNQLDNAKGIFSYGTGIAGGTNQPSLFLSLAFKAKKEGQAKVVLNGESLVLKDGENVLAQKSQSSLFNLIKAASATKVPPVTKTITKKPAVNQIPIKIDKSKLVSRPVLTEKEPGQKKEIASASDSRETNNPKTSVASAEAEDSATKENEGLLRFFTLKNVIIGEIIGLIIFMAMLLKLTAEKYEN